MKITVEAAPSRDVSLMLRIPGWASGASLAVNGMPWTGRPEAGSYAEVRRTWKAGDVLDLSLPMPVRLMQANPLVEEARNQVAVRRGPIVYCLESVDLEPGVRVADVAIPRGIALRPRFGATLLRGITVLEGRAEARPEAAWSGALYRELSDAKTKPIDIRLIPYYAWGNRGRSEMTVWMPLS